MPHRVYACRVCGATEERIERWDDAGPLACPKCRATAYHRVPQLPAAVTVKGSPHVNGERRFTDPRAVRNPDGTETVYTSLHEARLGELERARQVLPAPEQGLARTLLARKNARQLASGRLPGRDSTLYREAVEGAPR